MYSQLEWAKCLPELIGTADKTNENIDTSISIPSPEDKQCSNPRSKGCFLRSHLFTQQRVTFSVTNPHCLTGEGDNVASSWKINQCSSNFGKHCSSNTNSLHKLRYLRETHALQYLHISYSSHWKLVSRPLKPIVT